jgi:hypothetical protein
MTTHLHLVPRSKNGGAIPPLPNTPLWRGAQLKHRDNFNFYVLKTENNEEKFSIQFEFFCDVTPYIVVVG